MDNFILSDYREMHMHGRPQCYIIYHYLSHIYTYLWLNDTYAFSIMYIISIAFPDTTAYSNHFATAICQPFARSPLPWQQRIGHVLVEKPAGETPDGTRYTAPLMPGLTLRVREAIFSLAHKKLRWGKLRRFSVVDLTFKLGREVDIWWYLEYTSWGVCNLRLKMIPKKVLFYLLCF